MLKQPKRNAPQQPMAPLKPSISQQPFKQLAFKPDSPRFGNIPHRERQVSQPSFHSSLRAQNDPRVQNRRKAQLVFLRLENQLNKMVFHLVEKQRVLRLSEGFMAIKRTRQLARPAAHNYAGVVLKAKLQGLMRVVRNRVRLGVQSAFVRIRNSGQRNLIRGNSKYATKTYEHESGLLTELDRKGELAEYDRRTLKPSKKSALQTDPSKKLLQAAFKQNQNMDNVLQDLTQLSSLEQQNRFLRKQITREQRQQAAFVEMMGQLLDQYELTEESSTSRPNLISLCSSPEQLKGRSKNSMAEKNKLFKDRRF